MITRLSLTGIKCFILLISTFSFGQPSLPTDASYVWTNNSGTGRFQVAYFRYELKVDHPLTEANIHLFADSRYHLIVNGHFVNFGPARFYPEHPQFDTYDLTPYLRDGFNVIAIRVLSNGVSTFQLRRNSAGFIAWGTIKDQQNKSWSLSTPGNWKTQQAKGYDGNGIRQTFALGPMEVYDARKEKDLLGWEQPDFNTSDWQTPTQLKYQDNWGPLLPRQIPPLTQEIHSPQELLGIYSLNNEEHLYSFQVLKPDKSWEDFRTADFFLGYTYIYSPKNQDVDVGIWWGDHYLNGEGPLPQEAAPAKKPHRNQMMLKLKAGWNPFFVKRKTFFGKWSFVMAIPQSAKIQLSPAKKLNDDHFFKTSPLMDEQKAADLEEKLVNGQAPENLIQQGKLHAIQDLSGNPAIEMAWQYFDESLPYSSWEIDNVAIESEEGTALVYDFRYKKLGRIIIEYEAPEGTVIDVGFTEDLIGNQLNIMKRNGLYMATRHVAAGGEGRMETLKPYGFRYLQLNVHPNTGPVRIKKVSVANQVYPFEKEGSFECSDPMFNAIWDIGWRTLRVCAEDSYTDTPFRERGLYAGDMLPQMGITLAGSSDLRLVKRSLELFQDMYIDQFNPGSPRHPDEIGLLEDYPLLTLEALNWYIDRTGDMDFAKELFPAYNRMIRRLLKTRDVNGLIQSKRVFIEWTQIQKSDVKNTAYHAILSRSCSIMAKLAKQLNKPKEVSFYAQSTQELKDAIKKNFWSADQELFSDGIHQDTLIDHYYPISSIWPYLAGITDEEMEASIFKSISKELEDIGSVTRQKKITPYGSFYLFAALYEQNLADVAEWFIRKHWGPMVHRHNDTAWENFDDSGIGTLSHAWSGAPTFYFTTKVLGVDLGWPNTTSLDSLVISPQSATLDWAKGVVPHSKGPIEIAWQVKGNNLWVDCKVPDGVAWQVLPKGRLSKLDLWVNSVKKASAH